MKLLLCSLLLTAFLTEGTFGLGCFSCSSSSDDIEYPYDEDCGAGNYLGNVDHCESCNICFTYIYDDGHVKRGSGTGLANICNETHDILYCSCQGYLCNHDLCYQCHPTTDSTGTSTSPQTVSTSDLTTNIIETTTSISGVGCFMCSSSSDDLHYPYDEDCGSGSYVGIVHHCETCNICVTQIYDDGHVTRGTGTGMANICNDMPDRLYCSCQGYLCNHDLCYQCHPTSYSTGKSTSAETTSSSDPTVVSTSSETPSTTYSTEKYTSTETESTPYSTWISTSAETTNTIQTTTTASPGIYCYDCQNENQALDNYDASCSQTDFVGDTYFCNNCQSCYTQIHDDGRVWRGEAGDFADGECVHGEDDGQGYTTCYCTQDRCNTQLCEHCEEY